MIRFPCPHCGHVFRAQETAAGRVVRCTKCEKRFQVPEPAPVQPLVAQSTQRAVVQAPIRRSRKKLAGSSSKPWTRLLAREIDSTVYAIPFMAVLLAIMLTAESEAFDAGREESLAVTLSWFALYGVITFILETALLTSWGTTRGKAFLGSRVADSEGQKLGLGNAAKRSSFISLLLVLGVVPCVAIAIPLWGFASLRKRRQTAWDRFAGSFVHHTKVGAWRYVVAFLVTNVFWIAVPLALIALGE